ncbi:hypothetical protein MCERE85_00392 [Candidatus Nanopelagicaceae bacterium]|jgi:hypothetical protein
MTTHLEYEQLPTFTHINVEPISSDPDEDYLHPVLEMFRPAASIVAPRKPKLYLVPSTFGEEYDAEFAPEPTSAADLPDITELTNRFIHNVVEIWAGRRSVNQVQSMCHYRVFNELQRKAGWQKEIGRIRKSRITEPLDGICEATVTIRYGERLRVAAIRFEGQDQRWLCTSLTLI